MKTILAVLLLAPITLAGTSVANAADGAVIQQPNPGAYGGARVGYLDCGISGGVGYLLGSAKTVDCVFRPSADSASTERYVGVIRRFGVDVGVTTGTRMLWAVFAPTAGYHQGSLTGLYQGVTAEATAGVGVGANVLFGGTTGSVQLQPISLTGQTGLNVAATGTSMTLSTVN
ncbi:DUF992 domain-containing protein [Mesorhizobium xinjiangense]|uniref:DUF992 domain-containing protein n=1 Tax=Mesorhizobium xinjiangense TaxID=2678685 RepID=UPI0012EE379F|nr:DUF992 domain-containing protein [Mesorhizobium xinjiangense]